MISHKEAVKDIAVFSARTMYDAFVSAAQEYPDNIAFGYMGMNLPYKAVRAEVDYVADCFANFGIDKNDKVILCLPNVPNVVTSIYALNKIGATVVPIHPMSAPLEISFYVKDVDAKAVVCFQPMLAAVEEGRKLSGRDFPVVAVAPPEKFTAWLAP